MNVFAIRHGETAWSLSGQHTSTTDLPLTDNGRRLAERLLPILARETFALVLVSPLQRARETCELTGLGAAAVIDPDLVEWNYGDYEGKRTADILSVNPGWKLFNDGCPGGESPVRVAARADRVIARARAAGGNVLLFSSGHILRMIGARWLGLPPSGGAYFLLGTASVSVLSYEHDINEPVHRSWNDMHHLTAANK